MLHRGYHIVLEGPDASGKKTQSELLVAACNQPEKNLIPAGVQAYRLSFPDYPSPFGQLVREYLTGEGPSRDPAYASLLYAADRFTKVSYMTETLARGDWLICDRYVESNLAHQVARVVGSAAERQKLAQWILHTEYEVLGIPKADLTILLNVPVELCLAKEAERRAAEGNRDRDIHEQDAEHIRRAWEEYQQLAKQGGWPVVACAPDGVLLSRETIAEKIQTVVANFDRG